MSFGTTARTNMAGIVRHFRGGYPIKVFRHSQGWSVECAEGLLEDSGTDCFAVLEPLLDTLKSNGIDRITVEL